MNVFQFARGATCQLLPLFPYLDEGALVPAGAIMGGEANVDVGHFFHTNSVDEVVVVFGSEGLQVSATAVRFWFVRRNAGRALDARSTNKRMDSHSRTCSSVRP